MEEKIAVAIDGPAAAGKSSIAKALAKKFGYIYVDTGALYRAVALFAVKSGIDTLDEEKVVSVLDKLDIELEYENGNQKVIVNGEDVSEKIRTPKMSMAASNVSKIKEVRAFLLDLQRNLAKTHNVIMDGRDIATVILPNAKYKFFLTASPEVRAKRRFLEFKEKGIETDYEALLKETKERDYNDSHREIAPLKPHEDAVVVDSSDMTFDEVVKYMASRMEMH